MAASPLVYVVLFALCLLDGFFPPVPSETALVAIAAVAATSGQPALLGVLAAAAAGAVAGAVAGDSVAYWFGRRLGTTRLASTRQPRIAAAFAFAERQVQRRPASLILIGRYIPVGRVAVNTTAGATGLPYRRFLGISAVAGSAWAATSVGIALAASSVLHEPVVSALVSMVVAVVLGIAVDRVIGSIGRRREAAAARRAASVDDTGHATSGDGTGGTSAVDGTGRARTGHGTGRTDGDVAAGGGRGATAPRPALARPTRSTRTATPTGGTARP
ncbi:DedA family protein [Curtobacterium luteum]|nr:DedA family protein [Curtobacterium luteum]